MLIGEVAIRRILSGTQIRAQAGGYPLHDEQPEAFKELLAPGSVVDLGGSGDWTPAELRANVADYFIMLMKELAGEAYSKTKHRNALRQVISRSHGSIERKHQNISAVLQRLGFPWIDGYKPLGNYQDALVDVIEVQLDQRAEKLDGDGPAAAVATAAIDPKQVFVDPPPSDSKSAGGRSFARVIQKFDPAKRDAANRQLGEDGEGFVVDLERSTA